MKSLLLVLGSLLFCALLSCSEIGRSGEKTTPLEKADSCRLDPNHNYEIYIPERNSPEEKLPLVVIIDAQGGGKFALKKFKTAADQYPAILVASNHVKNGFENYAGAIQILVDDVRQKYPVSEALFLAGFSGGARMALGYSLNHPVNGLLMCGALAEADQINALNCPVFSISGTDDFNFVESAQYLFQDQKIPGNLKIELTNASHSWPDSLMLSDALGFLYLSTGSAPEKSQIKTYNLYQHERIERLKEQQQFLKAAMVARNLSTTTPFSSENDFASEYKRLKTGDEFTGELKKLEECLKFEMSVRQPYLEALTAKDSEWWKNEIHSLHEKLNSTQDSFKADMFRRIKAFWGIASYSLGNRAIKEKKPEELKKILAVYRMLEPENPDMFYFSAFPPFWGGDTDSCVLMLKKARQAGFSDTGRLKNDFPESILLKL